MSVDVQHRKQICKLLRAVFPNTQFIITTHDRVWAKQLATEGLVASKSSIEFQTWNVDTGPVLEEAVDVWDLIAKDLQRNEIPVAAGRLRRHLEYVSGELADSLGAQVRFRADGNYDLGAFLPPVMSRHGDLLEKATKAAKSWDDTAALGEIANLKTVRAACLAATRIEEWAINKAVHYNEWADLSRDDFAPVVKAFRAAIEQLRCQKPDCGTWLSATPFFNPQDLRCACGTYRLNLQPK